MKALLNSPETFKRSIAQVPEHHQSWHIQQVSPLTKVDYQIRGVGEAISHVPKGSDVETKRGIRTTEISLSTQCRLNVVDMC